MEPGGRACQVAVVGHGPEVAEIAVGQHGNRSLSTKRILGNMHWK
jgi:hypothetical protein